MFFWDFCNLETLKENPTFEINSYKKQLITTCLAYLITKTWFLTFKPIWEVASKWWREVGWFAAASEQWHPTEASSTKSPLYWGFGTNSWDKLQSGCWEGLRTSLSKHTKQKAEAKGMAQYGTNKCDVIVFQWIFLTRERGVNFSFVGFGN